MIVSKAIFGYLRDFHTLLFFVTCTRPRDACFTSIVRRRERLKDWRNIRGIERGKRYVHLVYLCIILLCIVLYRNVYNETCSFVRLSTFVLF